MNLKILRNILFVTATIFIVKIVHPGVYLYLILRGFISFLTLISLFLFLGLLFYLVYVVIDSFDKLNWTNGILKAIVLGTIIYIFYNFFFGLPDTFALWSIVYFGPLVTVLWVYFKNIDENNFRGLCKKLIIVSPISTIIFHIPFLRYFFGAYYSEIKNLIIVLLINFCIHALIYWNILIAIKTQSKIIQEDKVVKK